MGDYQKAYEDVMRKCSPDHSPWFVIPADNKWYRDAAVAGIVCKTLEEMDPQLPKVSVISTRCDDCMKPQSPSKKIRKQIGLTLRCSGWFIGSRRLRKYSLESPAVAAFNAGYNPTHYAPAISCLNGSDRHPMKDPVMPADDLFVDLYQRDTPGYGLQPSSELASYLKQVKPQGRAWDLGAGAGRNTLALARAGLHVSAFDLSVTGVQRIDELADELHLGKRIEARVTDIRELQFPVGELSVVVATTVLDHIPTVDFAKVWERIETSLASDGFIYAEVHTTEDPGCTQAPGLDNPFPISETASAVQHYFGPGELLQAATKSKRLRVLYYQERQEWDYTHGAPHHHGKAILCAVTRGFYPPWYGYPLAFPRRPELEVD